MAVAGKINSMRSLSLTVIIIASLAAVGCGEDKRTLEPGKAEIVSQQDLRSFAQSNSFPVYWAGPIAGFNLELTETGDGQVYVRYLPKKVTAGDRRQTFLTVGSYPKTGAWAELKASAKNKGARTASAPGGGTMLWYSKKPSSTFVAWPGVNVLVEVYWPDGSQAIVRSGQIGPVQ